MILFVKRNKIFIVVLSILFALGLTTIKNQNSFYNGFLYFNNENIKQCISSGENSIQYCNEMHPTPIKLDGLSAAYYEFNIESLSYMAFFYPIIITIVALYNVHCEMRSGIMNYFLTRMSYRDYKKRCYKKALLSTTIIPIFMLFMILIYIIWSDGNIDFLKTGELFPNSATQALMGYKNQILIFFILYSLNFMLNSVFWFNLGFMNLKRNKNFLVVVLSGWILFLGLWVAFQLFLGPVLMIILSLDSSIYQNLFNLLGIYRFESNELFSMLLIGLLLAIISTVIVWLMYKNKEKVIIESEK